MKTMPRGGGDINIVLNRKMAAIIVCERLLLSLYVCVCVYVTSAKLEN